MLEEENKKEIIIGKLDENLLELENIINTLSNEVELLEANNRKKENILNYLKNIENEIE